MTLVLIGLVGGIITGLSLCPAASRVLLGAERRWPGDAVGAGLLDRPQGYGGENH